MTQRLSLALSLSAACSALMASQSVAAETAATQPAAQNPAGAVETADVITVRSTPLRLRSDEVAGAVTVLTDDDLITLFSGNIGDTLDALPGVTTSYYGPASGRPIIRGLGDDRVRVLINGVGALDASTSSPDHAVAAEVLGAQGVEVLRGPSAIAYGGGAIGGVVNIQDGRIATRALDDQIDGFAYLGSTSVDEGTQAAGRLAVQLGPLVLQLDAARRDADGFDIPGFAESAALRAEEEHDDEHGDDHGDEHDDHDGHGEEEAFGVVEDAFFTHEMMSGSVSLVQDWGYVGLSVKGVDAEYGLPGHSHGHGDEHDEDHEDGHEDPHDDDHGHEHGEDEEGPAILVMEQTRIDLRGEVNLDGALNRLRWSFGHSDYQHAELEGGEVGTRFDKEGVEGRIELTHDHGQARQGAFGVQVLAQDFEAQGEEAYIEAVTTQDWGAFIVERWDFGGWGVEAGARAETRKLNGLRAERRFNTVSGSASLFARPGEAVFTALTVSRTERAPTDVEVFAFGPHAATETFEIGDLTLGAETAWSLDGAARWRGSRAFAEANVFIADYDGFIALFPTGAQEDGLDVFEYRQADAVLSGFELSGGADLGVVAGFELSADASVDYVRAELDDGGALPRIPPLSGLVGLEAERGVWSARAEARLVSEQDETAAFETGTPGYGLLNAQIEVRPFAGRDVALIAGVRNITDEEARVHSSFLKDLVPLPGRNVRLAVRAGF